MKEEGNKIYICIKLIPAKVKNANAFFLKSISKVDGNCLIATAILINSKKIDAMLLDLDSTACTALLAGVKTARSCSTSCQN